MAITGIGNRIYRVFDVANIPVSNTYTLLTISETCCEKFYVLAESTITDPLRNDKSDWIWFYDKSVTGVVLILQQWVNGAWSSVATLTDNTYGTYNAFGFFVNTFGEKAAGFTIDWQKILVTLGEGSYRLRTDESGIAAANQYSWEYCLQEWTADREEGTVKLEWYMNGEVGNPINDATKRDFGTQNRYNQIRIKGEFGFETLPFEREYVKYRNGKKVWLSNSFFKQYTLDVAPYESNVLTLLSYDMMLGDDITITDFNRYNPTQNVKIQVIPASNFEPKWNWDNKKAAVELKFDQLYQNAVHKRC